jgi:hypothetical protein
MSGLTGYLSLSGVDLSNIFLPIGAQGIALTNANNTFTGSNTFTRLTTTGPVTLPTTYSVIPTTAQLGGVVTENFTGIPLTTNFRIRLITVNLPSPGVYSIILNVGFRSTGGGTMTRFVIEVSTNSSQFTNNESQSTLYRSSTLVTGNVNRYITSYQYSSTTADTIYGLCLFTYSGPR